VKTLDGRAAVEDATRGEIEWGIIVMEGSSPACTLLISRDQSAADRGAGGTMRKPAGDETHGSAIVAIGGSCGVAICTALNTCRLWLRFQGQVHRQSTQRHEGK